MVVLPSLRCCLRPCFPPLHHCFVWQLLVTQFYFQDGHGAVWDEKFEFKIELLDVDVVLELWDRNEVRLAEEEDDAQDNFMGQVSHVHAHLQCIRASMVRCGELCGRYDL